MEVIKRIRKIIKNNRNLSMVFMLFLIICGYMFFFFSKSIFNHKIQYKYSDINSVFEIDKREITLSKWVYCRDSNLMELEFNINNKNFDGNDNYHIMIVDRTGREYDVEKIIESPVILVAQIKNVPAEWSELRASIQVQYQDNYSDETAKWYTNIDRIECVENIVTYHNLDEYYTAKLDRYIYDYYKEIDAISNSIKEENIKIDSYNELIDSLSQQKLYAAGNELSDLVKKINDTNTLLITSTKKIQEYEDSIKEVEQKISDYKAIKDIYENSSDLGNGEVEQ